MANCQIAERELRPFGAGCQGMSEVGGSLAVIPKMTLDSQDQREDHLF